MIVPFRGVSARRPESKTKNLKRKWETMVDYDYIMKTCICGNSIAEIEDNLPDIDHNDLHYLCRICHLNIDRLTDIAEGLIAKQYHIIDIGFIVSLTPSLHLV